MSICATGWVDRLVDTEMRHTLYRIHDIQSHTHSSRRMAEKTAMSMGGLDRLVTIGTCLVGRLVRRPGGPPRQMLM